MEILYIDKKSGEYKLKITNSDDLWHLSHVIEEGDLLTKKDTRTTTVKSGQDIKKGERETMVLTLQVEKIKFEKELRVSGEIVEGPDNISFAHHTFRLEPGDSFTIKKLEWKKYQIERLEKARQKKPLLLVCVLDRDQVDIASVTESGIEPLMTLYPEEQEDRNPFYKEITEVLESKDFERVIIAGPGFEKENLYKYLKEHSDLAGKIVVEQASHTGSSGIEEVLKRTENKIITDTRVSKESKFVDEFLKRIKTDGLVTYGQKEVQKAIEAGAVDTLLISVDRIRTFEELMNKTEEMKGKVVIINTDHSMGEQFQKIGGIGAFLRYKMEYK